MTSVTSHRATTFTLFWFTLNVVERVVTVDGVEQSAVPVAIFEDSVAAAAYAQSIPTTTVES